jgi:dihydroneopterin aldolase
MQILLDDIILFGYHGVHSFENEVGTNFQIGIKIDIEDIPINVLEDTVDYEKVFLLVKEEFEKTEQLLEVLADRIIETISSHFQQIIQIEITIKKLNPPIPSFKGTVGIKILKKIKQ